MLYVWQSHPTPHTGVTWGTKLPHVPRVPHSYKASRSEDPLGLKALSWAELQHGSKAACLGAPQL